MRLVPALELCRQIANGSKHGQFERNISAVISDSEGYDYGNPIIMEGDTQHRAYNVFYDALKWFEAFLRNEKVFPEELFVPKGD